MNSTPDRFTVINGVTDAEARQRAVRAARLIAASLAGIVLISFGLSVLLIASTGVADVSAAAAGADVRSTPQVSYFPSPYGNQATGASEHIQAF